MLSVRAAIDEAGRLLDSRRDAGCFLPLGIPRDGSGLAEVRATPRDRPGDVLRVSPARPGLHASGSRPGAVLRGLRHLAEVGRGALAYIPKRGYMRAMGSKK